MMPHIFFRTDSSAEIGTGHVMRCLALADALLAGGAETHFLCRYAISTVGSLISKNGHKLTLLKGLAQSSAPSLSTGEFRFDVNPRSDAEETSQAIENAIATSCDWLIVDHYGLDTDWERAVRRSARRILVIDDLADRNHDCDVLLDQNLHPDPEHRYRKRVPTACRLLLGPRYALLRSEFAAARSKPRSAEKSPERMIVSMGGVDPGAVTAKVIEAFLMLGRSDLRLDAILGQANPDSLAALTTKYANHATVAIHSGVTDMARRLKETDIVVGAGGIAMWERCCVGKPSITVSVAANQEPGAEALGRYGGTLYLGSAHELKLSDLRDAIAVLLRSPSLRCSLAERAAALVDGAGVMRVARTLLGSEITLRPAAPSDCRDVLRWRNDVATRRYSGDDTEIGAETHNKWFASLLADSNRRLLIGEESGKPVGVLRYDFDGDAAEVSIYLVPGNYGRGLGTRLLAAGEAWLGREFPSTRRVIARTRNENVASLRMFETAGFERYATVFRKQLARDA